MAEMGVLVLAVKNANIDINVADVVSINRKIPKE
jgi:hypothetical protein